VREVGDNRPYSGKHPENDIHDAHAKAAGLPHVELGFGEVGRNSYSDFAIVARQCIALNPQGGLCE
jgi:predicted N-formylglutamate amidohydrolase|tara:strand:+ start:1685 stop:1882 length:198 start_codon:yes stop_codon:yes gene_type:complete